MSIDFAFIGANSAVISLHFSLTNPEFIYYQKETMNGEKASASWQVDGQIE